MSSRGRTIAGVVALALLLLLYVGLVGQRAFALMGTGDAVGIVLGVAILVIPLLVVWFLVRELAQARAVDRLTRLLQTEGGLQIDDLPRSPGGRIDKAVAAERFDDAREGVESAPDDWRSWYHLGWAYDAAGDRRRARGALRTAVRMERTERRAGAAPLGR